MPQGHSPCVPKFCSAQVSQHSEASPCVPKLFSTQVTDNKKTSPCVPKFCSAQVSKKSKYIQNSSPRKKSSLFSRNLTREKIVTINNINNKVSLPHVYLKTNFNEKPLCFLIDTGSTISIVKLSSLSNQPVLGPEIIKLKGLSDNDSYCESIGSIELKFQHRISDKNKIVFDFMFHAIDDTINLIYDGIIGSDFIQYFKIDVQYSTNTLNLQGHMIPICSTNT